MTTQRTLLAIACVGLLTACNQPDTINAVDAAQDPAKGPVDQRSEATRGSDTASAYVLNAAMGDMYEIMAADIALERTRSAEVRDLAQMIKTDHTAASERFKPVASAEAPDVTLPTELDARRQGLIDNLRSTPAEGFDRVYAAQQVAAHQEAVRLHSDFSDNADAPQLAEHARTVLPRIEAHLAMAERIAGA